MSRSGTVRTTDEFMERVRVQPDGCWKWVGPLCRKKFGTYGSARLDGKSMGAHRAAWILFRGPISEGLTIDHLCENTRCVNPDHLDPCTLRENILRASKGTGANNARKTHCIRGHEFTPENTYVWPKQRACRTCVRDEKRRNAARRDALKRLAS